MSMKWTDKQLNWALWGCIALLVLLWLVGIVCIGFILSTEGGKAWLHAPANNGTVAVAGFMIWLAILSRGCK